MQSVTFNRGKIKLRGIQILKIEITVITLNRNINEDQGGLELFFRT